jgi:hypothetical protein
MAALVDGGTFLLLHNNCQAGYLNLQQGTLQKELLERTLAPYL